MPDETGKVVAFVRAGRARRATCRSCGGDIVALAPFALALTRPPIQCENCNPMADTWRRERNERPLRAAILALDEQVKELQEMRDALGGDAYERARSLGPPSRQTLARAVRRVGGATGARETADALLTLAAVAQAWAVNLTRPTADTEAA